MNYKKKISLKNKLSFVIGGSGLIGNAVTKALLEFDSKVVILDIKKKYKSSILLKNKKLHYEFFDISNLDNLEFSLNELIHKYGCPDIFVNCAYSYDKEYANNTFEKLKLKSFLKNLENLLVSTSWLSIIIARKMRKLKKYGSIINLGSIYGVVGQNLNVYKNTPMKENVTYSIAKGGIINLARQMTSYYGKYNIRINTISPGGVKGTVAGLKKIQDKNFLKNYSAQVPMGRLSDKSEIASTVIFLASDLSSYISGQNIIVDGGWTSI